MPPEPYLNARILLVDDEEYVVQSLIRTLRAAGPSRPLGGTTYTLTYYDYHSNSYRIHYGSELDLALACKIKPVSDRSEVGWRFGRYWADRLFTDALRTSIHTGFTL